MGHWKLHRLSPLQLLLARADRVTVANDVGDHAIPIHGHRQLQFPFTLQFLLARTDFGTVARDVWERAFPLHERRQVQCLPHLLPLIAQTDCDTASNRRPGSSDEVRRVCPATPSKNRFVEEHIRLASLNALETNRANSLVIA